GTVSTMALVPQVVDAVKIPVIAAGGIGDGRGLAAALALGAAGVQMGTRFICTEECTAHINYKKAILRAGDRSTMVTGTSLGHPVRCLRNPMAREFEELEKKGASEEEIIEFGTGRLRKAAVEGDVVHGSLMAGQISGLIKEILPAGEVVRRTAAEAEEILCRLQGLIV
ncbi:MAG: nitronate monooxygenase, partial [Anaerolineae bacterium]|nr:nitronate monooxygenase [Anaerolineae bacterium]